MKRLKQQNRNRRKLSAATLIFLVAGMGVFTGCAKPKTSTTLASTEPSSTTSTWTGDSGGTPPFPLPTSTPSPTPSNDPNLLPPITESFTVSGAAGTMPTYTTAPVDTDNILRVKVKAGPASSITVSGSNFSAVYSCVSYTVTALGQTITTAPLAVDGNGIAAAINCPGANSSQTLDFSSRLTPGHGPITITVKASGYDFYCQGCQTQPWLYGAYPYGPYSCSLYCPLHTVYKTHTVTGTLSIQVNGTNI